MFSIAGAERFVKDLIKRYKNKGYNYLIKTMQTKTHLSSTLIFIALTLSILFLLASVAVLSASSLFSLINASTDAATQMIMAFALGFVCLLLVLCAWFVLEKIRNKES